MGSIDTSKTEKIFIEKFTEKEQNGTPTTVASGGIKDAVYIGQCKGSGRGKCVIIVTGKCKSVTISGCDKVAVVVDNVIATVELINCKQVDVQAKESAPNWTVDKCDRTKIYLPEGSCRDSKAVILSSMSACTNVFYPTPDGSEMVESPVPDQIKSKIRIGATPISQLVVAGHEDEIIEMKVEAKAAPTPKAAPAPKPAPKAAAPEPSGPQDLASLVRRMEAVTRKLKAHGGEDVEEGGVAACVTAYQEFYAASVVPFIEAANQIEGTKKIGAWTKSAFEHCGQVIMASQDCAKPSNPDFMKFLAPIVKVITDSGNADKAAATFAQEKSYNEMIQALSWVMMDLTRPFVAGQLEAADFYLNKVLVAAKDKEDAEKTSLRDFVKTAKKMMNDLAQYCVEFHKTGLSWKFKGADLLSWKPGQAPKASAPSEQKMTIEDRLGAVCRVWEKHAANLGGGADEGGTPIRVSEYDDLYSTHVQPFIDACNQFEGSKQIGDWAVTSFKHVGQVIRAAHVSKKPNQPEFMKFLDPIVKVIQAAGNPDNRSEYFPQLKSFAECVQAHSWVMMGGDAGLPSPFIKGQLEAADFYLNKVLVGAKSKEDPDKTNLRAYVKTLKTLMTELGAYVKKHYKTGMEWNPSGSELGEYKLE